MKREIAPLPNHCFIPIRKYDKLVVRMLRFFKSSLSRAFRCFAGVASRTDSRNARTSFPESEPVRRGYSADRVRLAGRCLPDRKTCCADDRKAIGLTKSVPPIEIGGDALHLLSSGSQRYFRTDAL